MRYALFTGIALAVSMPAHAGALVEVAIDEWLVPYEASRPRDPDVAPDGSVWFVGQRADYVARFDPASADFRRYPLPDGAGPHNNIVAPDGFVWYAGNRDAHIGRLDPADGSIERIDMPDPDARDPHTLVWDADGNMWFTVQGGNRVGHLDVRTREVRLVEADTPRSRPYGIVVADDGRAWLNLLGTNRLAVVEPETMALTEIELPREEARTRRIAWSERGVWYVDWARGYLGVLDPASGDVREWRMPGGEDSQPYAMAVDAQGRIWAFETGATPNRLVGFDPEAERFFAAGTVPSGGGSVRHMVYHQPTNSLWFGTDTNYLGRARLP